MNNPPDKLNSMSLDISSENRTRLKSLFPSVFTETFNDKGELVESVDFEKLKAELGTFTDIFENRRERYGMDWPGKKDVLRLIQTPSYATLKPEREESVNFDTTENVFLEGDNLEVLKLLQKSYYGKVKMIYIDPPYNTGKEFIYPDDYSESLETYLKYAGLTDGNGRKFATNTANEGRFHTKWLNMMYPRLYLARNLLRDDGAIFISIDDNEVGNLRKLCDEIFGEENFVGQVVRATGTSTGQDAKKLGSSLDYCLIYRKFSDFVPHGLSLSAKDKRRFRFNDYDGKGSYALLQLRKTGTNDRREDRPNMFYEITSPSGEKVVPFGPTEYLSRWRVEKRTFDMLLKENLIIWLEKELDDPLEEDDELDIDDEALTLESDSNEGNGIKQYSKSKWTPYVKYYLENRTKRPSNLWVDIEGNKKGSLLIKEIFGAKVFDNPKPLEFIVRMIQIACDQDAIILDFFTGSATTAHGVLTMNKQDNGNRKFILVQLPEPCAEDSEAFKSGYKTIAEIGKERIRRVINKLNEEDSEKLDFDDYNKQDRGFKVLKLDKSNFKQWQKLAPDTSLEEIVSQLELHINHIDQKAMQEDLLYEILIKAGFTLTEKIETKAIAGKRVFSIANEDLLICLEDEITNELIHAVVDVEPREFICLDSAFGGNDQLKVNAVQAFSTRNKSKEKRDHIVFKTV